MGDVRFSWRDRLIIAAPILVALCRIFGMTNDVYKAFAHITFGVYLGGWILPAIRPCGDKALYKCAAIGLAVLEVVCFSVSLAWKCMDH